MKTTIKIQTNRIFFEQFPHPCGEPELKDIRNAWAAACTDVIEDAGFEAEVGYGVGYDPAVKHCVTIDVDADCDCDATAVGEDCDCDAKYALAEIKPLLVKYGEIIAEKAKDEGLAAAQQTGDEFEQESIKNTPDD